MKMRKTRHKLTIMVTDVKALLDVIHEFNFLAEHIILTGLNKNFLLSSR